MKAIILLILVSALSSCALASRPSWYQSQGFNLTECGPTVTAMAASWSGVPLNRYQARGNFPAPRWWNFSHIEQTLTANGVRFERLNAELPKAGELGIYHVDGAHFIAATQAEGSMVRLYDPLGGVSLVKPAALLKRISYPVYIKVLKSL